MGEGLNKVVARGWNVNRDGLQRTGLKRFNPSKWTTPVDMHETHTPTNERVYEAFLPDGGSLVRIEAKDGVLSIHYREGYSPDDMTRQFWEFLAESLAYSSRQPLPAIGTASNHDLHPGLP